MESQSVVPRAVCLVLPLPGSGGLLVGWEAIERIDLVKIGNTNTILESAASVTTAEFER